MSQCQNPAVPSLLADVVLHLQDQIQQVPSSALEPGRVNLSPWVGQASALPCQLLSKLLESQLSHGCAGDTRAVISADFN